MAKIINSLFLKEQEFTKDERGAVAIMFSLMLLPMILVLGITVDYARSYRMQQAMATALDSAVLALAKMPTTATDQERQELILGIYRANIPVNLVASTDIQMAPGGVLPTTVDNNTVRISYNISANQQNITLHHIGSIENWFMPVANIGTNNNRYDSTSVGGATAVQREINALEIAIGLDTSGSMNWDTAGGESRISAARNALKEFTNILYPNNGAADAGRTINVGIVPWTFNVQIPAEQLFGETEFVSTFKNMHVSRGFYPRPYACTVEQPAGAPVFWYREGYKEVDGVKHWFYMRWWDKSKVKPANEEWHRVSPYTYGPVRKRVIQMGNGIDGDGGYVGGQTCPRTAPMDFASNKQTIDDYIDEIQVYGGTDSNSGLYWTRQMLDPENPIWTSYRASFTDAKTRKVIIIMSDGANGGVGLNLKQKPYKWNTEDHWPDVPPFGETKEDGKAWPKMVGFDSPQDETYGEYPLAPEDMSINLKIPMMMDGKYKKSMNGRFIARCGEIINDNVTIYTIGFGLDSTTVAGRHAIKMLEYCGGTNSPNPGEQYFYNVQSADELEAAFKSIANSIAKLRLTM